MSDSRLPAHLEVAGLIRAVQAEGGFATVLARGERDGGTVMVVFAHVSAQNSAHFGREYRCYERMPLADGSRGWSCSKRADSDDPGEFTSYINRRQSQDPDLWIIELDIADGERFIGLTSPIG